MLTKRLNHIVKSVIIAGVMLFAAPLFSQVVTLDECVRQAREHSVNPKKIEHLRRIESLSEENLQKGYLPKLDLQGNVSYQSDVFSIPLSFPGSEIPDIPRDQYNFSLNLSQKIYDGGVTAVNRQLNKTDFEIQKNQVEVASYILKKRVTQLYFGVLSTNENLKILQAALNEIENQEKRIIASYEEGITLKSVVNSLRKEKLDIENQIRSQRNKKISFINSLSLWTGRKLDSNGSFTTPVEPILKNEIERPELRVYQAQQSKLESKKELIRASYSPKLSAYATTGYANPNPLNFFEVEWSDYYVLGARFKWSFWNWNESGRKREVLEARKSLIDKERENYLTSLQSKQIQLLADIDNVSHAIATIEQQYELQEEILAEARFRFEEGVMSASDYLSEVNEHTELAQKLAFQRLLLIKHKIDFNILTGN